CRSQSDRHYGDAATRPSRRYCQQCGLSGVRCVGPPYHRADPRCCRRNGRQMALATKRNRSFAGLRTSPMTPENGLTKDNAYRRTPSRAELLDAMGKSVPDMIAPGLKVLFCGINPGLYTAWAGHHFARPGNRFWPALFASGFTDRLLRAEEEH